MKFSFALLSILFVFNLLAQDTIRLKEVEVNANRVSNSYKNQLRMVQIVGSEELKKMPVSSIADVLDYMGTVDVRQRGVHNVQADLSIRGGNYEQTLVMVNGVPVNDPQTGHHSLNIPIDYTCIERIELLSGGDARRYGANAFSGAINIVTKDSEQNNIHISVAGGDFKYFEGQLSAMFKLGNTRHLVSISRYQSDGYRNNTDFNHSQAMWQISQLKEKNHLQFLLAAEDKAFGANSFYTPKYPNQFEQTHTLFMSLTNKHFWQHLVWTSQAYYRQHHDRFELFRHDLPASQIPVWYKNHNYHLTQVAGAQTNAMYHSKFGKTTLGFDYRFEHIYSNVLGEPMNDTIPAPFETNGLFTRKAQKTYLSLFADHDIQIKKWHASAGLMATFLSTGNGYFYPGAEIGYSIVEPLKIFISANRSLRLPTYTELYYKDAANEGNINLKPEEANNYEVGLKYNHTAWQVQAAYFYRQGKNIIDWVRLTPTDKWHSENITTVNTSGVEFLLTYRHDLLHPNSLLKSVRLNYMYIDILKQSENYYSKYALDVLRNKISLSLSHSIIKNLTATWTMLYHERMGTYTEYPSGVEKSYNPYLTVDAQINYQFNNVNFFISGTNLFNTYYYDIANIPMPGRWVKGGVSWSLK